MQVLYGMYIGIVGILYHDAGIVMGIPSHNVNFKGNLVGISFWVFVQ
jgi:hypothetical protein